MRCLVVGKGPTASKVDASRFDGFIISVHLWNEVTRPDIVFSADLTGWAHQEQKAIECGAKMVVVTSGWMPLSKADKLSNGQSDKFVVIADGNFASKLSCTSGIMAIEYAMKCGFTEIYTCGIDLHGEYIRNFNYLPFFNAMMKRYPGSTVYKACPSSTLPVSVRCPELTVRQPNQALIDPPEEEVCAVNYQDPNRWALTRRRRPRPHVCRIRSYTWA